MQRAPLILVRLAEQNSEDAEDWATAQAALDRLATSRKPSLTIREADNCLCFLSRTCLYLQRGGVERKEVEAFLVLMAKITPCEVGLLSPLPTREWEKASVAVKCYEDIRQVVSDSPTWISIYEIHSWWLCLIKYAGNCPEIASLTSKLAGLCEPVRLVFGKKKLK